MARACRRFLGMMLAFLGITALWRRGELLFARGTVVKVVSEQSESPHTHLHQPHLDPHAKTKGAVRPGGDAPPLRPPAQPPSLFEPSDAIARQVVADNNDHVRRSIAALFA